MLEYGAEREGYWTSEQIMNNIEDAARIIEFKYPIAWLLDHSSCPIDPTTLGVLAHYSNH